MPVGAVKIIEKFSGDDAGEQDGFFTRQQDELVCHSKVNEIVDSPPCQQIAVFVSAATVTPKLVCHTAKPALVDITLNRLVTLVVRFRQNPLVDQPRLEVLDAERRLPVNGKQSGGFVKPDEFVRLVFFKLSFCKFELHLKLRYNIDICVTN